MSLFFQDVLNPAGLWNDFRPHRWANPLSDIYPGLIWVATFTIVHFLLDKLFQSRSRSFAEKSILKKNNNKALIKRPECITDEFYNDLFKVASNRKKLTNNQLNSLLTKHEIDRKFPNRTITNETIILYHRQTLDINKHISKFNESFFKVVCFGFVFVYDILILFHPTVSRFFWHQEEMLCPNNDPNDTAQGWPEPAGDLNNLLNLNNFYWIQIGYHGHRAVYQFLEHSRRDFIAMFVHHWVTLLLLIGSYCAGYQGIGATVLLVNDSQDMFLPMAKLFEYLELMTLHKLFFFLFALFWVPIRIVLYFVKVLYPLMFTCVYNNHCRPYPAQLTLVLGLWVIYGLQFYWASLILPMLFKVMLGSKVVDTRSDDAEKTPTKKKFKKNQ